MTLIDVFLAALRPECAELNNVDLYGRLTDGISRT